MEEGQQTGSPGWVSSGFHQMLAKDEELNSGKGWVFLKDGITRLMLKGVFVVSWRGLSPPTPDGSEPRKDTSTPWDRISSHADVLAGKRELYVMSRAGVRCIQLKEGGEAALGGGVRIEQRPSARFPDERDFVFHSYG